MGCAMLLIVVVLLSASSLLTARAFQPRVLTQLASRIDALAVHPIAKNWLAFSGRDEGTQMLNMQDLQQSCVSTTELSSLTFADAGSKLMGTDKRALFKIELTNSSSRCDPAEQLKSCSCCVRCVADVCIECSQHPTRCTRLSNQQSVGVDLKKMEPVGQPDITDNGTLAAVGGFADGQYLVLVIDFDNQLSFAIGSHSEYINQVSLSPQGRRVASASADQTVVIWPIAHAERDSHRLLPHSQWVDGVCWLDEHHIASIARNTVSVWDIDEQTLVLQSEHVGSTSDVIACISSTSFVTGHNNGQIVLWEDRSAHEEHAAYSSRAATSHMAVDAMEEGSALPPWAT